MLFSKAAQMKDLSELYMDINFMEKWTRWNLIPAKSKWVNIHTEGKQTISFLILFKSSAPLLC